MPLYNGEDELVGISETAASRASEADEEMFKSNKDIRDIAKANSYEDLVNTFGKSYFKRGIVKTKNKNDRLVREILINNNLQNYMIHYLAEKIYAEANR